jgi:hypothetical protein
MNNIKMRFSPIMYCLFLAILLSVIFIVPAASKSSAPKPRVVASLQQAFVGHWKVEGVGFNRKPTGEWFDCYVTEDAYKWVNMIEGTYTVITETPDERSMLIETAWVPIGMPDYPPTTSQDKIIFSKDYRSGSWIVDPFGERGKPEKHRLRYIGKN